jgi:hypothetical protein
MDQLTKLAKLGKMIPAMQLDMHITGMSRIYRLDYIVPEQKFNGRSGP